MLAGIAARFPLSTGIQPGPTTASDFFAASGHSRVQARYSLAQFLNRVQLFDLPQIILHDALSATVRPFFTRLR